MPSSEGPLQKGKQHPIADVDVVCPFVWRALPGGNSKSLRRHPTVAPTLKSIASVVVPKVGSGAFLISDTLASGFAAGTLDGDPEA
jgi:hypothetical protein